MEPNSAWAEGPRCRSCGQLSKVHPHHGTAWLCDCLADEDERAEQRAAGAETIDRAHAFLGRFVAYPSEAAQVAHALWVAHAHLVGAFDSTPRIAFLSPEPASGKTRALEVTEPLVPHPVQAVNVTAAFLFRRVGDEEHRPTILFDEIDCIFGPKARENEELRGLLNAGHRRGAVAGRCVVKGRTIETEEIPAYCAVALAGLGDLPDTLLSRSVAVRMRRRAPGEQVEPFRHRVHAPEGRIIRDALAMWSAVVFEQVQGSYPALPEGIEDRAADCWEPLLAVADAAGGDWPERARVSAVSLVSQSREAGASLGIRLLADLRAVFIDSDSLFTTDLLERLNGLEEAPWGNLRGQPLDARGLANRLRCYGVTSRQVRVGDRTKKGYRREDLFDPWHRYLPAATGSETSETAETPFEEVDL